MKDLKNIIENESTSTFEYDNVIISSTNPYVCERYSMHYEKLKEVPARLVATAVDEALNWVEYDARDIPFNNPFNIEAWAYMYAWAWNQGLFKNKLEGFNINPDNCWLSAMWLAEREWGTEKLYAEDILDKMMDWWNLFHKSEKEE